jgi:hypothetical protein
MTASRKITRPRRAPMTHKWQEACFGDRDLVFGYIAKAERGGEWHVWRDVDEGPEWWCWLEGGDRIVCHHFRTKAEAMAEAVRLDASYREAKRKVEMIHQ